ncbi:MAG: hypothetical protein LLG04_10075 [Parachlamydia sp.]|nr:hypothetical protein [Parachlamydia sp.]
MHKLFATLLLILATNLTFMPICADGCKTPKQGPPGPRGPRGPQGRPGISFSPSFISVFRTNNQAGGIAPGAALIFDKEAVATQGSALTYNTATGSVTFQQTGFFEVTFGTSMDEDNVAGGLVLQMNPAGVYSATPGFAPGTGLVPGSEIDNAFPDELLSLSVMVEVTSVGQTMQLVNGNSDSFNIQLNAISQDTDLTPIVAYMVVKKL